MHFFFEGVSLKFTHLSNQYHDTSYVRNSNFFLHWKKNPRSLWYFMVYLHKQWFTTRTLSLNSCHEHLVFHIIHVLIFIQKHFSVQKFYVMKYMIFNHFGLLGFIQQIFCHSFYLLDTGYSSYSGSTLGWSYENQILKKSTSVTQSCIL